MITNSWVFTGFSPDAAVLNLQTDVPTVFIYEGNFGPAGNSLIVNGGKIPLDEYLDRTHFPPNYFKFVIEPNEMTDLRFPYKIPDSLKPLVNFIENEKFTTSKPTTGIWERGQHLWNKEPSPGGNMGWVCVESGKPGEWTEFGTIGT